MYDKREFYAAMRVAFTSDKIVLVQRPVHGKDYRLVVLDDKVMAAYERIALNVMGDGNRRSRSCLRKNKRSLLKRTELFRSIRRRAYSAKTEASGNDVLVRSGKRSKVFLLDSANLSSGGDSVDVTDDVHPEFKKLAIKLTKDMGLRLAGVDLMIAGDITDKPKKYWILEINAGPGLDHFSKMGKRQEKIVEDLYIEMLKSLDSTK